MDNVAFLITVAVVYASVIWFLPVPIVFNWKHLFPGAPSHSTTDATVQALLQEHKKNWPDWIPVFTRSGEAYLLLWLVSTAFSIAFSMTQVDMPRQIGHVNGVAYVGISLFIGDPWFGLAAYAACCPLKLVLASRSTFFTGATVELVKELLWCLTNDVVTCIFVFSILQHIDILLSNVLQTTVDLEHQIREREKSMQERGHLLSAARRLLSVTCDCCEQLSDSFEVMQPSQNVLALLHIKNPEEDSQLDPGISSLPLRQFICDDDQERFAQFMTASHESQAASSLHLCMRTRSGSPFEAQIFHVKIPETNRPHLIGIKSAVAEMTSIPEHSILEAQSAPAPSGGGGPAGQRELEELWFGDPPVGEGPKIAEILLTVNPSEAYEVESLEVLFSSKGAKLTSWISTRSACLVEGFLQHHLNCWQHAEQSIETCKKVHFRVPEVPACFTAGEMSVAEILEAETGEDLPRSMRLLLRSISQRQSTRS
ncbi:unnamed protein product [Symbiodinium sp. CCMP2592]|nr:unnamed protein product [Symbiodinium sp. CCMP2592]